MPRHPSGARPGTTLARFQQRSPTCWADRADTANLKEEKDMETPGTEPGTGSTLQAYVDKIAAQIHAANTRIDEFEARTKPVRDQAEITAINGLKVAKENIERMVVDLRTTRDAQVARARADIDAAIGALQASLEDFRRKFTTPSAKK
jgi:hypothetical protein